MQDLAYDLLTIVFAALAWYITVFDLVGKEITASMKRIEKLDTWQSNPQHKTKLTSSLVLDAKRSNDKVLAILNRHIIRYIIIWLPAVLVVSLAIITLIRAGLDEHILPNMYIQNLLTMTYTIIAKLAFIVLSVFLAISTVIMVYTFWGNPEPKYITVFRKIHHEECTGMNTTENETLYQEPIEYIRVKIEDYRHVEDIGLIVISIGVAVATSQFGNLTWGIAIVIGGSLLSALYGRKKEKFEKAYRHKLKHS